MELHHRAQSVKLILRRRLGRNNGSSAVENPYNEKIDTGSCSYDIRHNIAANIVYLLPFHGNRF